jgi:hypothetical protein
MQTSRFQLGLIATLAMGLGFTLSSPPASGYPAGAAVSYGANPLVSAGGSIVNGGSEVVVTAPSDQALVLTDLLLTSYSDMPCKRVHRTVMESSSGAVMGEFETSSAYAIKYYDYDSSAGQMVSHRFSSGLSVPAGESVTLTVTQTGSYGGCDSSSSYGVRYSVSGYYTQP